MRAKTWLAILVMGFVGMAALGFLTKFAIDSNPSLLRVAKIKQAIAEELAPRGVEEVSLRALPQGRGLEIRIQTASSARKDPERLAREVSELFVRQYGGPAPTFLKLTLVEAGRFGCGGGTEFFAEERSVVEISSELQLRAAIDRARAAIQAKPGFRVASAEPGDPLRLRVAVPAPGDDAALERSVEFLRSMARQHLAAGAGRVVVLEVVEDPSPRPASPGAAPGAPKLLREERIDRRGISRLRPAPAPEGSTGAAGVAR
jgi:hypothetical protein